MTVFILDGDGSEFSINRETAALGFSLMGEPVERFELAEFDDLPLTGTDVVCGGIGLAHRAFARLGWPIPSLDAMPQPLEAFAGRDIWTDTIGNLRRRVDRGETLFAKPVPDNHKQFDGGLFASFRDLIATAALPDDMAIVCATPVSFLSEYRCFVLRGDVLGLRHYKGDPLVFPDPAIIQAAVLVYDPAPSGYALDFGVTEDGRTLVVEVNDGYSSAAYGLTPLRYANLIAARWAELRSEVETP